MNALQALSLNVAVQDLILNHLMLATLDSEHSETASLSLLHARYPTDCWISHILGFKCRALELLQITQSLKIGPAIPRSSHWTGSKVSKPSYSNVATKLQCPLCNGSHRLFKCEKFLKLQGKQCLNRLKYSGLCFNCLQPFTKNQTCLK